MRTREPVPERSYGGDHPQQAPPGQLTDSEQDQWSQPSLTIAEAARLCDASASAIRRYRPPGASQAPTSSNPHPRPARGMAHPDPGAAGSRPATTPGPPTRPSTEGPALGSPHGEAAR